MTDKEIVLEALRAIGKSRAAEVQSCADIMTGTDLNSMNGFIPRFSRAKALKNMLSRHAGFVCMSSAGRVVKLIQPYDSDTYSQEPEELPAQWAFVWSKDPKHARPFIALSTSPYMTGDVCELDGAVYAAVRDAVVHSPAELPEAWEKVET